MSNRFKMTFNNSRYPSVGTTGGINSISSRPAISSIPKHIPLNAPMINRVYKAKPGCSACGKKVA